ncbi:jg25515 [Pararge aegeria aegeria]|uniref:Jg25515 protein n=1 Tax=Pararge aegeria aegeria TaxID=348720 RepID=A0A8S4S636_9NEOP|nr:jg25515 [Pararge aegeria aegeria]
MAGANNAMFIFEVVVGNIKSMVESRHLLIKSDFGDVFSLELKDPKTMHIVIPEPPPLPPEPPGKKGKKAKSPKPKKGKKGVIEAPPPEPVIQSGQSILFSSNAEFIIQTMKKFPLELSLWSKEDNLTYIGGTFIPWDPAFYTYLEKVCDFQEPPPVTIRDDYNIFEEGKGKLMAKIGLQIKLTYLTDKLTTAFRTLSEDPSVKKVLYTGINSKTTSYMCTLKTTDEEFEENCNKVENNFVIDNSKLNKIVYADYKNAPGANLTFFNDGDYCCMRNADKPPESIYKAPETCPDVDFIIDYVRKIIVSCNDNMRMLTPRPTIKPRIKATDIDRLCYCKQTNWPEGQIAERFKNEAQSRPCPMCTSAGMKPEGSRGTTFDIANITGPCGKTDCKIARDLREYIENIIEDENKEIDINDIIGPCGSKECRIAERIQEFLRHEGVFSHGSTLEGLSTQCGCIKKMQEALTKKESCDSSCSKYCAETSSEDSKCDGKVCPYKSQDKQIYNVYYFTVEYDFEKISTGAISPGTEKSGKTASFKDSSGTASPSCTNKSDLSSKFKYCSTDCPSTKTSITNCSKSVCSSLTDKQKRVAGEDSKCQNPVCPHLNDDPPSPADSDIVVKLDDIYNPCCVKSCDVAEIVKDFIVDGIVKNKDRVAQEDDPCFCDCECTFKLTKNTRYCDVCGGYECLGEDVEKMPDYAKPHPCPVYHKLYDKKLIQVHSPWSEEEVKKPLDAISNKSSRTQTGSKIGQGEKRSTLSRSMKNMSEKKIKTVTENKAKSEKKTVGKFTANVDAALMPVVVKRPETKYPYPPVPKTKGWNWTAEDIPGMKPRPKWKPGAANKILVRRYRAIREGVDTIAKKKRAMMQRKKKIEMKPTLIVKKEKGEYTVQMEVFKKYSKDRLVFQYPYDEKPPLVYTIGKTLEEKRKIQRQLERRERRETRRKSRLLQSTFRDRCQEICVKAFNQAMGVLPLPNPNDPECPCGTEAIQSVSPPIDSCSCSDEDNISSSDTDNDEWIIQFTPPAARWDVKAKHPPVQADDECQYNYLDYKVKLLDKQGNPVPRFFKGPDGKQECSDLGGFWGPDHAWLEINKDGYIGPDFRWVPMNFAGPDGMFYSAEEGFFTDSSGRNLKIGVDGYIDNDGKWAWYSKPRGRSPKSMLSSKTGTPVNSIKGKILVNNIMPKEKIYPKRKIEVKNDPKRKDAKPPSTILSKNAVDLSRIKKTVSYSPGRQKSPLVMSVSVNFEKNRLLNSTSIKNASEEKKIEKYKEIMKELEMYDDIPELKRPGKTNRASNTLGKSFFPFTEQKRYPVKKQNVINTVRPSSIASFKFHDS